MTVERLRAEIRALRRIPGGAFPRALALLDEVVEMEETETIVAAALSRGGVILTAPPPLRHHDLIHWAGRVLESPCHLWGQGFLTSTGRYVGRKEGARIALAAGQPIRHQPKGGIAQLDERWDGCDLYSEDLW